MANKKTSCKEKLATDILCQLDLDGLLDSMTFGVLFVDPERRILTLNRFFEALTGHSREEVIGVHGDNVMRSNLSALNDPIGKALEHEKATTVEGNIINQNRKKIPVRFNISPLKLTNGNKAGAMVTLEDISLLKDLDSKVHGFSGQEQIIGQSMKMQEIFELLPIAARSDASVLITGETGTGKDLVAEAIHKSSSRSRYPFIKVNCGALPESLLESELFGHVRGAFTGADKDKPGMFRLAHGGTLFLTEIGDLSLHLQVKILTVLDDKEFFPVGGSQKTSVDVRIITATHRDLTKLVRQGKFREDLYYRLNVLRLHLPPLREREEDFRLLLDHFYREFRSALSKNIKGFSSDCLHILSSYHYPGNVRELRNIVEYAVNVCQNETILPEHLPKNILSPSEPRAEYVTYQELTDQDSRDRMIVFPDDTSSSTKPAPAWGDIERSLIMKALTKTGGNRTKAAEVLGWSRSKLWRKIKHHALE